MSRVGRTLLILLGPLVGTSGAHAQWLYWTNQIVDGGIYRADLETMAVETLIPSGLTLPARITIDPAGGKMYWTGGPRVHRANLDGTGLETIYDCEGG